MQFKKRSNEKNSSLVPRLLSEVSAPDKGYMKMVIVACTLHLTREECENHSLEIIYAYHECECT